jgi:hypothetical protein
LFFAPEGLFLSTPTKTVLLQQKKHTARGPRAEGCIDNEWVGNSPVTQHFYSAINPFKHLSDNNLCNTR